MTKFNNSTGNINTNQNVTSTAISYTALLTDYIIEVTNTSAVRTITMPAPSTTGLTANTGKQWIIKDTSGGAATNNITITPASGTIDNVASVSITSNYGSITVYTDGVAYYTLVPTAGGLIKVSKQTVSAVTSMQFTGLGNFPSNNFRLVVSNYSMSVNNTLLIQLSLNNGVSYITTGYNSGILYANLLAGAAQSLNPISSITNGLNILAGQIVGATLGSSVNGYSLDLFNLNSATGNQFVAVKGTGFTANNTGTQEFVLVGGIYNTAINCNAFQILSASGNFTGTFTLYGYT